MLRPLSEVEELNELYGSVVVYTDPVLRRNRRVYSKLIRSLLKRGMVKMSLTRKSDIGIFCVEKKDGL